MSDESQPAPNDDELVARIRAKLQVGVTEMTAGFGLLIRAIKAYREMTGASLVDAKGWVEAHPACYALTEELLKEERDRQNRARIQGAAFELLRLARELVEDPRDHGTLANGNYRVVPVRAFEELRRLTQSLPR